MALHHRTHLAIIFFAQSRHKLIGLSPWQTTSWRRKSPLRPNYNAKAAEQTPRMPLQTRLNLGAFRRAATFFLPRGIYRCDIDTLVAAGQAEGPDLCAVSRFAGFEVVADVPESAIIARVNRGRRVIFPSERVR